MTTFYRRRYHRDSGMSVIGGAVLIVGTLAFAMLLGVAFADWLTDHDSIAAVWRAVTR